ncbi:zonular occludens toxin domain-containing protein [Kingella negevensis]|uniref:zonular occludens toxin domain-containing protein n=1 Tax=Kingella negevensis TaxID=1522312 RepID=UPI0025427416|nr:zonular occludens toxin domain-containing protein [Kingella negevensis]WII93508.1 zonular occludens toxin domain-containing protein [Kingella negevensis]
MAEIVLVTGTPGAGKTAHVVHLMVNDPIFKDQNGESRKVFTNINGLTLPHIHVSTDKEKHPVSTEEQLSFHDCYKWIKEPENIGSIIIIDEAQDVYPTRSNGSQVPPNVAWLNTHRHLGVDIFIITQNPKNIDINLRGLVNKHLHVAHNKLGMRTLLEWKYCANNPITQAKDGFSQIHSLDKKVFDLYKSAELHTKNKGKISKVVFILPLALLLMPLMLYKSYTGLKNIGKTEENPEVVAASSASSPGVQQITNAINQQNPNQNTLGAKPEDFIPRLAERPETKPLYDNQRQVTAIEYPVACIISTTNKCTCYSEQGTKIKEIQDQLCKSYVNDGFPFNPYKKETQQTTSQTSQSTQTPQPQETHSQVAELGGKSKPSLIPNHPDDLAVIQ